MSINLSYYGRNVALPENVYARIKALYDSLKDVIHNNGTALIREVQEWTHGVDGSKVQCPVFYILTPVESEAGGKQAVIKGEVSQYRITPAKVTKDVDNSAEKNVLDIKNTSKLVTLDDGLLGDVKACAPLKPTYDQS